MIGLGYEDYTNEWEEIFEKETSKRSFEEEAKLVGFGRAANKPEGEQVEFDEGAGEAWAARYTMQTFALAFILTEEAIEDELYDSLGKRYATQLGRSMAKTKEYNAVNVLNLAFSNAQLGGDGVSLANVAHPTASGITNSNMAAVGTDLNQATLENAIIQIGQWVDERGLIIAAKGRKLIIPLGLQFIAKRILMSPYSPGTSDNDINALKEMNILPEGFRVNHYLTDPDAWFILTTIPDGLKLFQRISLTKSKDGDFNTGNVKLKARERYGLGFTDPLAIYASQGAS
jgi:hypothetical protein